MRSRGYVGIAIVVGAALAWAVAGPESPGGFLHPQPSLVPRVELAPRFAWAEVDAAGTAAPQRDAERIEIPAGSAVSWSVRVPRGGQFGVDRLEGPPGATLEAEADDVASAASPLSSCATGCRLPLEPFEGLPTRLTVRAPDAEGGATVTLTRPVLYGEATPDPPSPERAEPPPPIVLYLVDTLRADRLGAYGNDRGLTPEIDAFAAEATVFENASAQASWTKPATASIMTGLLPMAHRLNKPISMLPRETQSLAEYLRDAGYRTGAAVTNTLVDRRFGFDQGFDVFASAYEIPGALLGPKQRRPVDSDLARAAMRPWLDELPADAPFFLYLHVLDPHAPHDPPEPYRSRLVSEPERHDLSKPGSLTWLGQAAKSGEVPDRDALLLETLYDAEVAYNDREFAELLDELKRRGRYDASLIVYTSDHGEAFFEHGFRGHTSSHYQELLHIPLIVKAPHQTKPHRVRALAQQIDLLPTLLDYAGIPLPERIDGASLRAWIEGGDDARGARSERLVASGNEETRSLRDDRYKLLIPKKGATPMLFDLADDPQERRDVADAHPIRMAFLKAELARIDAEGEATPRPPQPAVLRLDKATREELRALGYHE